MATTIVKMWLLLAFGIVVCTFTGCRTKAYDNSMVYFNTYYNANRLLNFSEDEFAYADELKRVVPIALTPQRGNFTLFRSTEPIPPFMKDFIIDNTKLMPVKVKVDSIIIKGSKILAQHPKSDFIDKTLYLMATAFFYRSEWVPSQIKCQELIDRYEYSDKMPDVHLLLSKSLIVQRKFPQGRQMLSRTVDIAWQFNRWDVLSQAFRLIAELELFHGNLEEAMRPYRQAIAQSDDDALKARWQADMAALLFREGKFVEAEKEFALVRKYDPDVQATFESLLYEASCKARLGRVNEAQVIIEDLESNRNYDEWASHIHAEKMTISRVLDSAAQYDRQVQFADSAFVGSKALLGQYFERGMDYIDSGDYRKALPYFGRSKSVRSGVFESSTKYYNLLSNWAEQRKSVDAFFNEPRHLDAMIDSINVPFALNLYELCRIHEQLGNFDSSLSYVNYALKFCPKKNLETARLLFAKQRLMKQGFGKIPVEMEREDYCDSLLEVIAFNYPTTDHGREAKVLLGLTDEAIIDTAKELYTSGLYFRKIGSHATAINKFESLVELFPRSTYTARALYTLGWTFEHNIRNLDSAIFYYNMLVQRYNFSEYTTEISPSLMYALAHKDKKDTVKPKSTISDSTQNQTPKGVEIKTAQPSLPIDNRMDPIDDKSANKIQRPVLAPSLDPSKPLQPSLELPKELSQPKQMTPSPAPPDSLAPPTIKPKKK
ncbi:MAG: hypothetical protein JNL36_06625 [Candidatus Kapabacteria bacterium]|nr:hypothetical protein [Candidatus Kapabacteria bacterium]